ncbi:hypothetical protein [Actinacidiphila sp. ITFR-21]|uniref:hypothetical protein n=1 Tax=Actinacidiphila sp. ITFR-21 TaxID=3075199 RepID=UPI0028896FB9|nr:hypothetical protein [Streptomyces sp. ITFR-21]WNI16261.1 hypothetical protein RLT57_12455 [Streptomyces sp. ITFR-21]
MSDELTLQHLTEDELPPLRSEEEMEQLQLRMSLLVGEVARASASLEDFLRTLMIALLDSKYGEVAAAGLGANELVDMCTALAKINHELTEPQRAACRSLLGTVKPLLTRRNSLVHGVWAPEHVSVEEPLPSKAIASISKRRSATVHVEISFEEAEKLAEELSKLGSEIFTWTCRSLTRQLRREQVTEPPPEATDQNGV